MTRTLSSLAGISAALASLWTLVQLGIALAVEEMNAISLISWGPASAIPQALLRPIRWARTHGLHPGFHRRREVPDASRTGASTRRCRGPLLCAP